MVVALDLTRKVACGALWDPGVPTGYQFGFLYFPGASEIEFFAENIR